MREVKVRNPGYPGFGVPISYLALLILSSLVLFVQKRKPRNSGSRFRIPKARRKALTKPLEPSKAVIKALLSPYLASPEPPKIRNRAPQFFYFIFLLALVKPLQSL